MEKPIQLDPVSFVTCAQCRVELDTEGLPPFSTIKCPQCGVEAVVHATLGNFVLTRLLGSGGMGAVYEARDSVLNRAVAVKVMHKSLGEDPVFVENFLREAQAAARLNHPSLVQVYSFGQENGMPYIVMELVAGGSFDKLIQGRGGKVDAALALRVGMEAAEGLKHAADNGLVHGDIKPENILLDENGAAKIVDFGLASLSAKTGPQQGGVAAAEIWGTPYYIAPEKVRRQKSDFRSDIYSLGATLFHAIAGIPPFEGKDSAAVVKARLAKPAPQLAAVLTSVDPEAAAVVDRMLQADPNLRHPTYDSLLGDMRRYVEKAAAKNILSKRVVIKGKSSTGAQNATGEIPSSTGPVPAPDAPGAPKKKGIVLQRGIRAAAVASINAPPPPVAVSTEPGAPAATPKNKKSGLFIALVTGVSLFAIVLVGAIVGFVVLAKNKAEKARQLILAAEEVERNAGNTLRNAIQEAVDLNAQVLAIHADATNTLQRLHERAVEALGDVYVPPTLIPRAAPAAPPPAAVVSEPAATEEGEPSAEEGEAVVEKKAPVLELLSLRPDPLPGDLQDIAGDIWNLHNKELSIIEAAVLLTVPLAAEAARKSSLLMSDPPSPPPALTNEAHKITSRVAELDKGKPLNLKPLEAAQKRIDAAVPEILIKCNTAANETKRLRDEAAREEAERKAEDARLAATAARLRAIAAEQNTVADAATRSVEMIREFEFNNARRVLRDVPELEHDEAKEDLALA